MQRHRFELRNDIGCLIVPRSLKPVRKAIFAGKVDVARSECAKLAEAGNIDAQACFAAMLWDGVGGDKDCRRGEQWAKKASAEKSTYAQYLLAHFAFERNQKKLALRYLQQAADHQYPPAVLSLGRCLILGYGVPEAVKAGLQQYTSAKALEHRLANVVIWDYWSRMAPTRVRRLYSRARRLFATVRYRVSGVFAPFDEKTNVRRFG